MDSVLHPRTPRVALLHQWCSRSVPAKMPSGEGNLRNSGHDSEMSQNSASSVHSMPLPLVEGGAFVSGIIKPYPGQAAHLTKNRFSLLARRVDPGPFLGIRTTDKSSSLDQDAGSADLVFIGTSTTGSPIPTGVLGGSEEETPQKTEQRRSESVPNLLQVSPPSATPWPHPPTSFLGVF